MKCSVVTSVRDLVLVILQHVIGFAPAIQNSDPLVKLSHGYRLQPLKLTIVAVLIDIQSNKSLKKSHTLTNWFNTSYYCYYY